MSRASSMMIERAAGFGGTETPVSLGYDRIRFLAPMFLGDTITLTYRIETIEPARRRATSKVEVTNHDGKTVAVADHILKWVKNPES